MTVVENASTYVSIYPVDPMPAAITALRAGSEPVWVFAYGSLMWNPEIAFAEARPGVLHGYHRSFCLYSRDYRGTPERPGLVLGLDRGGSCRGIVYRLGPERVGEALDRIWAREMTGMVYRMRRVPVWTGGGALALSDVSLTLEEGAFWVLTGASGAGKSTLLNIIALAEAPSEGRLRLFDADVAELDRAARARLRRRIGIVFQECWLIEELSAR